MVRGVWLDNGEPIVTDEEANILQGQHRLWAVITADVTVPMTLLTGVKRRVGRNGSTLDLYETYDQGKLRSLSDVADDWARGRSDRAAAARAMLYGVKPTYGVYHIASDLHVMKQFQNKYREHIEAAERAPARAPKRIRRAAVTGTLARILTHMTEDEVVDFCQPLRTGVATEQRMQPAAKLRDWLISNTMPAGGITGQALISSKVEAAMRAYHKGRTLGRLLPVKTELYPIDEDQT
jgi:hypothetical protein